MVHMLCPHKYRSDSMTIWNKLRPEEGRCVIEHIILSASARKRARAMGRGVWENIYKDEAYDITQVLQEADMCEEGDVKETQSDISYDILLASSRQMMFHYQTITPHWRTGSTFLHMGVNRYLAFLHLKRVSPSTIIVPTFDIDLVWHAHQMHPTHYYQTSNAMCGLFLPHDDTLVDRSEHGDLTLAWNETVALWEKTYGAPYHFAGGMWRGNVTAEERSLRPLLKTTVRKVESHVQGHVKACITSAAAAAEGESDIEWVHRNQVRMAKPYVHGDGLPTCLHRSMTLSVSSQDVLTARVAWHLLTHGCPNHASLSSFAEVFCDSCVHPIASVHDLPPNSMTPRRRGRSDRDFGYRARERVLVIRVGGEDICLLGGKWKGFSVGNAVQEGYLDMRIWPLNRQSLHGKGRWREVRNVEGGLPGVYSCVVPIGEDLREIKMDLEKGNLECDAAGLVTGYAIMIGAGMLYTILQPRFIPRGGFDSGGSMYLKGFGQDYEFLRGCGGEILAEGREGVGELLLRGGNTGVHANLEEIER